MVKEKKKTSRYLCSVDCPHCGRRLSVIKDTEVLRPADKGEVNVTFRTEKEGLVQTHLPGAPPNGSS
jgi:hypothetical protein